MNDEKLWLEKKPAKSLGQIYRSCVIRLKYIKTKLDQLDQKYQIDEQNRFKNLSNLSASLSRLRDLVGIGEIKSKQNLIDIIQLINHNIKITCQERQKEIQREAFDRQILIQETREQSEDDDERLKKELRDFFNFSNKLSKIIREKQEENNQLNYLDKKRFDPLITPLLNDMRKNYIKITDENKLDLNMLILVCDQIDSALDQDYIELIDSMETIAFTCEKYLLSFYQESHNIESKMVGKLSDLLEQVVKYDLKKISIFKHTKKYINYLRKIQHSYQNENGVELAQFSENGKALSARFDLNNLQVLLIIPEHSFLLNECAKMLGEWIEYDSLYVKMVENDIIEIEKKRKGLLNDKINFDRLFGQLLRRLDLIRKELLESCANLKLNLIEMCSKRPSFGPGLKTFFEQIEAELCLIEKEMNKLNLIGSTDVLKWSILKGKLECLEYHMRRNYGMQKVEKHDLDVLNTAWLKLKNIHLYKISDQTLEKIFYDLELPKFNFGLHSVELETDVKPVEGLFMNVIELVSKLIGSDWKKLYYALPFHPERGAETIQKDVDKIFKLHYRGDCEREQAFNSLIKWKRVHHRSKLEDIRQALQKIKRNDILKEIDQLCSCYDNKCNETCSQMIKKSSAADEDLKKREAEILHQQLCKFFEGKNKANQFDFKFSKNTK